MCQNGQVDGQVYFPYLNPFHTCGFRFTVRQIRRQQTLLHLFHRLENFFIQFYHPLGAAAAFCACVAIMRRCVKAIQDLQYIFHRILVYLPVELCFFSGDISPSSLAVILGLGSALKFFVPQFCACTKVEDKLNKITAMTIKPQFLTDPIIKI